jgi:peroxiredoxin
MLKSQLDAFTKELLEDVGGDAEKLFAGQIDQARKFRIPELGLSVGASAPNFSLPDATGATVELNHLMANGPVVLTFYRGGWCPYCNIQLRAYQGILNELKKLGASLVAVSPETPDNSLDTRQREELEFHVLSDNGNLVAKQFGLVFPVSTEVRLLFEGWDINLENHNGIEGGEIPVPATYIIDEAATIIFGKPDVDYRTRVEPKEILRALSLL